jgi:hypothetical protein
MVPLQPDYSKSIQQSNNLDVCCLSPRKEMLLLNQQQQQQQL